MAKFTKLNIGDSVASGGGRVWKKLSAESATEISFEGVWKLKRELSYFPLSQQAGIGINVWMYFESVVTGTEYKYMQLQSHATNSVDTTKLALRLMENNDYGYSDDVYDKGFNKTIGWVSDTAYDLYSCIRITSTYEEAIALTNTNQANLTLGLQGVDGEQRVSALFAWLKENAIKLTDNFIRFTIDYSDYMAEDGMTWAEWVESDYNTRGCTIGGNDGKSILDNNGTTAITDTQPVRVLTTDTIISNGVYYGIAQSGSGGSGGSN